MTEQQTDQPAGSVIVTGAAQGIGLEIATVLLRDGWQVVLADIDEETVGRAAGELDKELGQGGNSTPVTRQATGTHRAMGVYLDVADEASVTGIFDRIEASGFAPPVAVVNNAGIQTWASLTELELADWNRTLAVNLTGCFLMTRELARRLKSQNQRGAVVNIGSGCNRLAFPKLVDYAASKGGIEMFTKTAALELGPQGIRVNCVAPGAIEVERTKQETNDYAKSWSPLTPLGRIGKPNDIAEVVSFLLRPESGFVTGQTIAVDGGVFSAARWPESY